jgi:DegV family protein with EDD domain
MSRIKVVTDSTADLTREQIEKSGLTVVPLNVHFGDEVYKDGVTIKPSEFYARLRSSSIMPRTSQPSAGEFMEVYQRLAAEADTIVSVHISSQLSGTLNSAETARGMVDVEVVPFDTRLCSQAAARCALLAAREAAAGKSKEDILAVLEQARESTLLVFCADTLEYLQKNGRIGRAQAVLGSMLQVKPVLTMDKEGHVASYDKVRGRSKVLPRMLLAANSTFGAGAEVDVSVIHSVNRDQAEELLTMMRNEFKVRDAVVAEIGPVVGAHIGPGAIGLIVTRAL